VLVELLAQEFSFGCFSFFHSFLWIAGLVVFSLILCDKKSSG
jgi:hypothetical protein